MRCHLCSPQHSWWVQQFQEAWSSRIQWTVTSGTGHQEGRLVAVSLSAAGCRHRLEEGWRIEGSWEAGLVLCHLHRPCAWVAVVCARAGEDTSSHSTSVIAQRPTSYVNVSLNTCGGRCGLSSSLPMPPSSDSKCCRSSAVQHDKNNWQCAPAARNKPVYS